ncbi:squamosa promoter-binding-like protein 15 [Dioscorea cayenensis subsp. rotundata]|uniref:Squamosa promoter-binding-like protein 15 n=1 Tax=Dioscorea cayennensis subsp. rotundata TaxID=55577 RepID=A0AB40AG21_DIOCR|nr:squamosa promoter-binding-like protein 15 [Dioscorea cayenensis subsp. rotundata]
MEREVGAQVAPPMFIHQPLAGRFHEPPVPKKRDLPWQNPSYLHNQLPPSALNPNSNWNPRMWDWDSVSFSAKPSETLSLGTANPPAKVAPEPEKKKKGDDGSKGVNEVGENLTLKLGGGSYAVEAAPVVRPSKRVRSGSPGSGGNYPMCQVDDCKADLSGAKDYHRRHKVCEPHSKTSKALVAKQMQRFCQQCSRFHPLSEFDEGKRSCRRRLAGHNRRRRKTQPEDASSRLLLPGSQENGTKPGVDLVNLLSILTRLQGTNAAKLANVSPLPDKNQLVQIISKLNALPHPNSAAKLPVPERFDLNVAQASPQVPSEPPPRIEGNPSASSTMDLLAVLSAALAGSAPHALASLSQGSNDNKAKIRCADSSSDVVSQNNLLQMLPPAGQGMSSSAAKSTLEVCKPPAQEARSNLTFQLFNSVEDDSPPKFASSRKYLSSESSNPMEERSPSSSPPVAQKLFPLHPAAEGMKNKRMVGSRDDSMALEASTSYGCTAPLELFKDPERRVENGAVHSHLYHPSCTSSSGSDHSPSSSNSDAQDRTDRIIFKLFDKDPGALPGTLRGEILNWLSSSPSEMESYIRPGCVVLSVYVSMPSVAWDELEDDLHHRVNSLIQCSGNEFWRKGRFLVRTSRQLVSHKDGKIHLSKSWKAWSAPELISVSPVAIVGGQEASLVLRGRNLTVPGTKIHCTYMGGYTSKEVLGSAYPGTIYDDSSSESFSFPGGSPNTFGRCFIEVENGFKGNSFPIIIADATICQELRGLESEIEDQIGMTDLILEDPLQDHGRPRSRDDVLHFLNELGWLFQRTNRLSISPFENFSSTRFKFLLTFSVDRDLCALMRKILDILAERSLKSQSLVQESLNMLSEVQLLSRAVKRKCWRMINLLLHYSVTGGIDASKLYPFLPNMSGPGGLTPLHLAACTQDSDEIVDALTNDPQQIGLNCWNSIQDDNGQTPFSYASMRSYHSYNTLVTRKLEDWKNGQVSITVQTEDTTGETKQCNARPLYARSCAQCASIDVGRIRPTVRSRGLLQRPYVHSMLAIAAVCVCVCLFFRGSPDLGCVAPFKWENLDYGPR